MSCGAKPIKKTWDKSRNITVVKNSKYEQNDPSVKAHWRNVIKELESLCKDDKFWESQASKVKQLVEPHIYERLRKIFNLPLDLKKYSPRSASESVKPSEEFYRDEEISENLIATVKDRFSLSNFDSSVAHVKEEEVEEEWISTSEDSEPEIAKIRSSMKSVKSSQLVLSKVMRKSRSKSNVSTKMSIREFEGSLNESTTTNDDLEVHVQQNQNVPKHYHNPHYELLYCSPTEMDMVTWNSNHFIRSSEISASDAVNKKAEIATKKIAKEFYEWWTNLGSDEFKSELRGPEDIEALFQVWFNEQASRGIVLDPRTIPCVLNSVATAAGAPQASCPNVLKRHVEYDIYAEKSPEHVTAFNTCLPQKLKHIPPKNDTAKLWDRAKIPEDLKTMGCVWDDIMHLTSTQEFHKWLARQPHMPMPTILQNSLGMGASKKSRFAVPSGFLIGEESSTADLQFPVSVISIELEDVLKNLMSDI